MARMSDPNSLAARVLALPLGETETVSRRIERTSTASFNLASVTEELRDQLRRPVAMAREKTGANYTIETGIINTRSGDMIAVAAATRITA